MSPGVAERLDLRARGPVLPVCRPLVLCLLSLLLLAGPMAGAAPAAEPPRHPPEAVERYLESEASDLTAELERYNAARSLLVSHQGSRRVLSAFWSLERLDGDRVFLVARFEVGQGHWDSRSTRQLLEFRWRDGRLRLVGHGPPPALQDEGVTADVGRGCTENYYAPNPCVGTARRWAEFAEIYGLPLDRESATIYQAFSQDDRRAGERMLAAALGEAPPETRSVYPLQAEVDALNLSRYQQNLESPCDLDVYGPKPCPQIEQVYRDFARRQGLPDSPATAQMFAAYATGDFRRGDTLYALANDLEPPDYETPTAGIGRDVARAGLVAETGGESGGCTLNPYATRPCLSSVSAWERFRERYRLEDTARNARIFEAYAQGDFEAGDQLFAEAKNVTTAELLEAAGVDPGRLVIEVYPGGAQ